MNQLIRITAFSIFGASLLTTDLTAGMRTGPLATNRDLSAGENLISTKGVLYENASWALLIQGTVAVTMLNCNKNGTENIAPPTQDGKATEDFIKAKCQPADLHPINGFQMEFVRTIYQSIPNRFIFSAGGIMAMAWGQSCVGVGSTPDCKNNSVSVFLTFSESFTANLADLSTLELTYAFIEHVGKENPKIETNHFTFLKGTEAVFQYSEILDRAIQQ